MIHTDDNQSEFSVSVSAFYYYLTDDPSLIHTFSWNIFNSITPQNRKGKLFFENESIILTQTHRTEMMDIEPVFTVFLYIIIILSYILLQSCESVISSL